MDVDNLPERTTPYYSEYQRQIFLEGATTGQLPNFSTDPIELEKKAKEVLSRGGWYYASSNAGQGHTHRANREAFYRWRIIPRMLRDTTQRDVTTQLFGHKINSPIGFAPIGINKIYHPLGELNSAKVAAELGLPYCLSTAGSQSIPDVAKANGNGLRFYQLYWPHDDELTISLLKQALEARFSACILTTDTWQLAWRHNDIETANYAFYQGIGWELGKGNPVFQQRLRERGIDPESPEAGQHWIDNVWHGESWDWSKLPWLVKIWKDMSGGKPFILKGVQCAADASIAASIDGVDGLIVTNHAGRQVDGAVGSLDQLEEIVNAVGDKVCVMFDSGVRSASDVFKAIALGAKCVFIGRLWVYGMSIAGEAGVRHVMKSLLADFDILMNVAGYRSMSDVNRDALKFVPNGGSSATIL